MESDRSPMSTPRQQSAIRKPDTKTVCKIAGLASVTLSLLFALVLFAYPDAGYRFLARVLDGIGQEAPAQGARREAQRIEMVRSFEKAFHEEGVCIHLPMSYEQAATSRMLSYLEDGAPVQIVTRSKDSFEMVVFKRLEHLFTKESLDEYRKEMRLK